VLPAGTPARVRELLRRCLHKESRHRLRDIGDARMELGDVEAAPLTDGRDTIQPRGAAQPITRWGPALLAIVAVAIAIYVRGTQADPVVTRLDVVTPPTGEPFSFALSPDGRALVFAATNDNRPQFWLRQLDQATAVPLPGTDGGTYPFWSPDSRSIGFFADAKLKRLDLGASMPQVLADAPTGRGGTWNGDGVILFAPAASFVI